MEGISAPNRESTTVFASPKSGSSGRRGAGRDRKDRNGSQLAREAELDLVEVAPMARPPVAKLMDYGKFKYENAQKLARVGATRPTP